MVSRIRSKVQAPLAMMTYANVVFSYGTERYLAAAQASGIAALILPDVPFEEKADFAPACKAHGIQFISLVAPTSRERSQMIASQAEGFVYLVSSLGVTGARAEITTDIGEMVGRIREATNLPVAVGFGISTPEQARSHGAAGRWRDRRLGHRQDHRRTREKRRGACEGLCTRHETGDYRLTQKKHPVTGCFFI